LGRTALLAAAFYFVIASHYVFKSVCGALVVKKFGAKGIPRIDALESVLAVVLCVLVLSSRRLKARFSSLVAFAAFVSICVLVSFPVCYASEGFQRPALVLFYIAGGALVSMGVYCVWMLLTATVVTSITKHITVFGAGAQLAVVTSGFVTKAMLPRVSVPSLALLVAAGYVVGFALVVIAARRYQCFGGELRQYFCADRLARGHPIRSLWEVLRSRYTRLLALVILAQTAFGQIIRWRIYEFSQRSETVEEAVSMLSTFFQYSGYACLAAQLVVVPLAFRFVTPRYGLLVQPAIGVCSLFLLAGASTATGLYLAVAVFTSFDYTLNNCMRESLLIPTPLSVKVHLKSALALLVPKAGVIVSSAVILLLSQAGGYGWVTAMACVVVVWVAAAWQLLRAYSRLSAGTQWSAAASVDEMD
jgi:hypothetical protein